MNTLMVEAVMKALKRANIPVYKAANDLAEISVKRKKHLKPSPLPERNINRLSFQMLIVQIY